ncbi:MMP14 [Mytilus edulis]|uniref:MMP14 n=1 Tax=Mytilus edulis TaxID=6550 RepID=A0A8S3VE27_MYTED|nr:MMP14 [Mytilus edulis]
MDIVNRLIFSLTLVLQFIKYETLGNLVINADETNYLMKYGYIPPESSGSAAYRTEEFYKDAVKNFQMMANLPVTGVLDTSTKEMMKRPRCGVKDDMQGTSDNAKRKKRYALHGSKWSKHYLTYKISKYGTKLKKADVDRKLTMHLKKYSGPVDIDIRFEKYWHGDNNPFDGQGQTLAHAFFPQFGGDAHFDDDEPWTINLPDGKVNTEEHTKTNHTNDNHHYHYNNETMETTETMETNERPKHDSQTMDTKTNDCRQNYYYIKSPVVQIPHICRHAYIDAITRLKNGETYIFKGKHHYRLTRYGIEQGFPRRISWDFKGVEGPIDSAITWDNGYTYIFKDDVYWKFQNTKRIYGPKKISVGFSGVPAGIDAAVVWSGNGKTYFFKDGYYWRYSGRKVEYGYPRPVSVWRGLPRKITAAFKWENGRTYFFSGEKYYRYNDHLFTVDSTYPRSVATWWLGCPNQGEMTDIRNPYAQDDKGQSEKNDKDEQWITCLIFLYVMITDVISVYVMITCVNGLYVIITCLI